MRVCIIGAGVSGLVSIKACLEEAEQFQPVCFERTNDIGGLWRFREDDGQACVMRSTVINTSKEMMAISDFPPSSSYPNFMHNSQVQQYLRDYADKFNLRQYIQFRHTIEKVEKCPDFNSTGQWIVTVKDDQSGVSRTETFGAVLVCVGHHANPHVASFAGLDTNFQGQVFHPHSYRDCTGDNFKGKRVLIVGIGNSGGDLAVELSRVASQVFLSTRRGTWLFKRILDNGLPIDLLITRRWLMKLAYSLPQSLVNAKMRMLGRKLGIHPAVSIGNTHIDINHVIDHRLYSLEPEHEPMAAHPTVNDDLPNRIICGSVKVKTDVKQFTATGCEFVDGTVEDNLDVVTSIVATGYKFSFPFLPEDVISVVDNRLDLYKYVFPPKLERSTLAFIGYVQPLGALHPISEGQARWAVQVFKGMAPLPTAEAMLADVEAKRTAMASRYVKSPRHTIQVDWVPYMDEIHEQFGARPNMLRLWLSDPRLASSVWFGPCLPYHYRLDGPHAWPGAREAILNVWDRVRAPLATRPLPPAPSANGSFGSILCLVAIAGVLLAVLALLWPNKKSNMAHRAPLLLSLTLMIANVVVALETAPTKSPTTVAATAGATAQPTSGPSADGFRGRVAVACSDGHRRAALAWSESAGEWRQIPGANSCPASESDADAIRDLCRRAYPGQRIVNVEPAVEHEAFPNWCPLDNSHRRKAGQPCPILNVRPFECLSGPFQSPSLLVPRGCEFKHNSSDTENCQQYAYWRTVAKDYCANIKLPGKWHLDRYAPLRPCNRMLSAGYFAAVEFVCCPEPVIEVSPAKVDPPRKVAEKKAIDKGIANAKAAAYAAATAINSKPMELQSPSDLLGLGKDADEARYQRYLTVPTESGHSEHERFLGAKRGLQHHQAIRESAMVKELQEAESRILRLSPRDPESAQRLLDEVEKQFRRSFLSVQREEEAEHDQLDSVHQQRVNLLFVGKLNHVKRLLAESISEKNAKSAKRYFARLAALITKEIVRLANRANRLSPRISQAHLATLRRHAANLRTDLSDSGADAALRRLVDLSVVSGILARYENTDYSQKSVVFVVIFCVLAFLLTLVVIFVTVRICRMVYGANSPAGKGYKLSLVDEEEKPPAQCGTTAMCCDAPYNYPTVHPEKACLGDPHLANMQMNGYENPTYKFYEE
uniref:Flavin-containing monooxygenase n=1 Tax=Macrostomum lignano TaxID=282301 RepID=A0A1I8H837_9PLAT